MNTTPTRAPVDALLAACEALLAEPCSSEARIALKAAMQPLRTTTLLSERLAMTASNVARGNSPGREVRERMYLKWADEASALEAALRRLLKSPGMNLDGLEDETLAAIAQAQKVLGL